MKYLILSSSLRNFLKELVLLWEGKESSGKLIIVSKGIVESVHGNESERWKYEMCRFEKQKFSGRSNLENY